MPAHGWTCFHCGETFTTEGAARDHFGARPEDTAACRIKAGEERGLLATLRRAEGCIREERGRVAGLVEQVVGLNERIAELGHMHHNALGAKDNIIVGLKGRLRGCGERARKIHKAIGRALENRTEGGGLDDKHLGTLLHDVRGNARGIDWHATRDGRENV